MVCLHKNNHRIPFGMIALKISFAWDWILVLVSGVSSNETVGNAMRAEEVQVDQLWDLMFNDLTQSKSDDTVKSIIFISSHG